MTLRRGRNGWARKSRRSLGSAFGAWSAATYSVRWLQDTVPRLCAKFGAQRCTIKEISSWTRKWWTMCLKSGYTSSKWMNWYWGGLIGLSVKMIQWCSCVNVTPQSNSDSISERAKQRDTSGHFRGILIHYANKASRCCLSLQSKLILGFWVLLDEPVWCIEEILAIKPSSGNSPGCDF